MPLSTPNYLPNRAGAFCLWSVRSEKKQESGWVTKCVVTSPKSFLVCEMAPPEIKTRIDTIKAGLKDGTFSIWKGPIVDSTGKEVVAAGAVADDKFLSGVKFYVKGVEGKVPGDK